MRVCIHIDNKYMQIINTAKLEVENSAQTRLRFSPISFHAPIILKFVSDTVSFGVYEQVIFSL